MSSKLGRIAVVVLLFVLFGWLVIHTGRLPGSAGAAETRLNALARKALHDADHDWATVDMSGQFAELTGVAPNDAARVEAMGVVRRAAWGGGVLDVRDRTDLLTFVDTYILEARYDDEGVHLFGYAPTRESRESIIALVEREFGQPAASVDLRIASGAPDGSDWFGAAQFGFDQLSRLRHGVFSIAGETMRLEGEAAVPALKDSVEETFAMSPSPFASSSAITATSYAPPEAAHELTVFQDCQARLGDATLDRRVTFDFGSAEIGRASFGLLDDVGELVRRCAEFTVRVEGHTDSRGDPGANRYISAARAEAVVEYFVNQGIPRERFKAQGLGPDEPIASNDTADGRERNRRIEFEFLADADDPPQAAPDGDGRADGEP